MNDLELIAECMLDERIYPFEKESPHSIDKLKQYAAKIDIMLSNEEATTLINACEDWPKIKGTTKEAEWNFFDDVMRTLRNKE